MTDRETEPRRLVSGSITRSGAASLWDPSLLTRRTSLPSLYVVFLSSWDHEDFRDAIFSNSWCLFCLRL